MSRESFDKLAHPAAILEKFTPKFELYIQCIA